LGGHCVIGVNSFRSAVAVEEVEKADKHFQWVPVEYGPYQRAANVPLVK
jgi:hypothetical protein